MFQTVLDKVIEKEKKQAEARLEDVPEPKVTIKFDYFVDKDTGLYGLQIMSFKPEDPPMRITEALFSFSVVQLKLKQLQKENSYAKVVVPIFKSKKVEYSHSPGSPMKHASNRGMTKKEESRVRNQIPLDWFRS